MLARSIGVVWSVVPRPTMPHRHRIVLELPHDARLECLDSLTRRSVVARHPLPPARPGVKTSPLRATSELGNGCSMLCGVPISMVGIIHQCVAVFCSVLWCVAACCSVLQCVAACCCVLQCVAACCSVLQGDARSEIHSSFRVPSVLQWEI